MPVSNYTEQLLLQVQKELERQIQKVVAELIEEGLKSVYQNIDTDLQDIRKIFLDIQKIQQNNAVNQSKRHIAKSIEQRFGKNIAGILLGQILGEDNANLSSIRRTQSVSRQTFSQNMLDIGRAINYSQQRNG